MSAEATASYVDPENGITYPLTQARWRSDQGRALMITPVPGMGKSEIDAGNRSIWRYRAALPLPITAPVSLGEGLTPLVEHSYEGAPLHFKLDAAAKKLTAAGRIKATDVTVVLLTGSGLKATARMIEIFHREPSDAGRAGDA
jgi:threonine synthase